VKAFVATLVLVPVLTLTGAGQTAAPPPWNGRIVFVVPGGNGIASMNPDGSGTWELGLGGSDGEPAFSPDGTRLAVAVRWPGIEGISVMDPDGWTNRLRLTTSYGDAYPTWSPDGSAIAFATGTGDIAVVAASGGMPRLLTTGPAYDRTPAWSPDGRWVAFVRQEQEPSGALESSVWVLDTASGAEKLVVPFEQDPYGYPGGPSWSPSGELTYVDGRTVFLRSADGTKTTRLVEGVDYGTRVTWAPAGDRLLFVREASVWLADAGGSVIGRLGPGLNPSWQPLPTRPGASCTLWGTRSADILVGTSGPDIICGLPGNDTVLGLDGIDTVRGGPGDDWVAGGHGEDVLVGAEGADRLDSRDGLSDAVFGGPGDDTALVDPVVDTSTRVERRQIGGNLAAWAPVRVSGVSIVDSGVRAVDGRVETAWNAGGWPPQWIEVDLPRTTNVGRIRLVAGVQEAVTHLVLGKGPSTGGAYRLLRTVKGPTGALQQIVLQPKKPWRGIRTIRIETHAGQYGAGWVSWHEIEVYGPRSR
jgi:Tol biopolymer transport system component